jgi:ferredoxin
MALIINDDCTGCDACKPVCPNEAISVGNPIYVIDPDKCTECVGAHDTQRRSSCRPSTRGCTPDRANSRQRSAPAVVFAGASTAPGDGVAASRRFDERTG